ncbi:molybdenum cofactor biosynthesis protein MoaE [Curvibacter sp. CHRR-16]|uniref:molybdenum cofactor biosynthesis protein MoaE n=1 Tax=Curvibacter sp. CHRR-16 TaxID=2835872 RepID=UPI001BDA84F1|nr:molybdenum cofactor biosynthesis protein MoaE [Curvibacter sp. CHRR-16]MBT0571139.1 molybdenum cofactor biosynthesis protein MoaE [Curvibacter sp. CHRR-16]
MSTALSPLVYVHIQTQPIDVAAEQQALYGIDGRVGAVCTFLGTVRDRYNAQDAAGSVQGLELEHYPGMTEAAIESMAQQAIARFGVLAVRVVHRVGPMQPADVVVLVAVSAVHRGAAFQACEFVMDYLKTQAPFWKKESTPEDTRWVDARASDDAALQRWGIASHNSSE